MRGKMMLLSLSMLLLQATVVFAQVKPYQDNSKPILVNKQHPEFVLRLKSNPSTGYSWTLAEYDHALILPLPHHSEKPAQPPIQKTNHALVGASTYELWPFRVKSQAFNHPQNTTILMVYQRPWNKTDHPSKMVFTVKIMGLQTEE